MVDRADRAIPVDGYDRIDSRVDDRAIEGIGQAVLVAAPPARCYRTQVPESSKFARRIFNPTGG
jgi:hypothetical protein